MELPVSIEALRRSPLRSATAVLVIAAAAACGGDSSTGSNPPPPPSRRVAIGDTVSASASTAAPDVRSFQTHSGDHVAIEVAVSTGQAVVTVIDSATSTVIATGDFLAGATFDHNALPSFDAGTRVYLVIVSPYSGSSVSVRYVIAPVNTNPETAPAVLSYGQTVPETLGGGSDIDDFKFDGAKDDEVLIFVQGKGPPGSDGLITVRLIDDTTGTVLAQFFAHAIDPDSQSSGSGRVRLPRAGRFRIDIFATIMAGVTGTWQYGGPYRVELLKLNRAPEHVPATVAFGDTIVGESIDYAYDVDEYRINATAGDEFNVFLQAVAGPATNGFKAQMTGIADSATRQVVTKGTDTLTLLQNSTGRFRALSSGPLIVRVTGWEDGNGIYRGPYRLLVEKVNRAPEHVPAGARQLGDTIVGERIDFPGDVDEIPFTLTVPTLVHVEDQRFAAGLTGNKLTMRVVRASDDSLVEAGDIDYATGQSLPVGGGTLTTRLDAGDYILRASSDDAQFGYYGAWSAVLQRVDSMPEQHASTLAPGDTVVDAIDPVGDIDSYQMPARRGRHYQITFQSTYNGGTGSAISLRTDPSLPWDNVQVNGAPSAGLADAPRSQRIDATKNVPYAVHVAEYSQGRNPAERGPYRFVIGPFDGRPEHHSATVAVGDSVTDEWIDAPGDLDQFLLSGAPGQEISVDLRSSQIMSAQVVDTSADSVIAVTHNDCTPRFRLPPSGQVLVDAMEDYGASSAFHYFLRFVSVHRAPEQASATYTVGDTVTTESLEDCADVDEFQFAGTAGQRVRAFFDLPNGDRFVLDAVLVEISAVGSDVALTSGGGSSTSFAFDYSTGTATLPVSGTYVVRIRHSDGASGDGVTPYRFYVRDEP